MVDSEHFDSNQFFTFFLGKEIFAVNVEMVKEVLESPDVTTIPRTRDYMAGIMNLRGQAVPVVDLPMKLGLGPVKQSENTCAIVVEVEFDGEFLLIGALCDQVREVQEVAPEDLEPSPAMGTRVKKDFIYAVGRHENSFVTILDMEKIFSPEELQVLA